MSFFSLPDGIWERLPNPHFCRIYIYNKRLQKRGWDLPSFFAARRGLGATIQRGGSAVCFSIFDLDGHRCVS